MPVYHSTALKRGFDSNRSPRHAPSMSSPRSCARNHDSNFRPTRPPPSRFTPAIARDTLARLLISTAPFMKSP
jgi:hypothetical protein